MPEVTKPLIPTSALQPSYNSINTTQENENIDTEALQIKHPTSSYSLWQSKSYKWSLTSLILLLIVFTSLEFALLKLNLPSVDPKDRGAIKFPKSLEDLRQLNHILSVYMDQHFINVYITFVATYLYLQSFSIPGSMWLSILGGTLFNFWLTLFTVATCSAVGASIAYLISGSLGSKAVTHLIGDRIAKWNEQLVNHKKHMFNYMIILRIAPFPPNWTINLGSPHLGVPLSSFFWGTFLGVIPLSFIHVQVGAGIDRLSSSDKLVIFTPLNVACLIGIAIAALIPVYIRKYYTL